MCTNRSGCGVVEHRCCHCIANLGCDVDVVVSSLEVDSLYDVPFLSSCGDCNDVASALLPCTSLRR